MKRIIILGVGCVTAKYLADALRPAGYEPVFLLDVEGYSGPSRTALEAGECHRVDAAAGLLRDRPDITAGAVAISGFFDELFPLIGRIAAEHGLGYPGAVAIRLADKAEVARLVPEYSPRSVVFPADEVPDLVQLSDHVADLVLKPGLSSGGLGAVRMEPDQLTGAGIRAAIKASGVPDAERQTWLLQERLPGKLMSVEGYATGGVATVIGYSLRGRIGWTEVSNLYPADDRVPAAVRDRCEEAVRALVARSGFAEGYFHCEFLVDGVDAHLIDANMGRLGGATVVEQIAYAHGITAAQVLRHALLLPIDPAAAGPAPPYLPPGRAEPTMSFFYGLERGGQVRAIHLPDDFACVHTQFARPGSVAPPIGTSDYAWVGMLTGPVAAAVRDIDRIRIETEHGPVTPCYAREP
jgi:hypothetical protein